MWTSVPPPLWYTGVYTDKLLILPAKTVVVYMVTSSSQPVSSKFFSNRTAFPVLPVLHNPSSWLGTWLYLPRLSGQHFIRQAHGFGDSTLSNKPIDQSVKLEVVGSSPSLTILHKTEDPRSDLFNWQR